MAKLKTPEDVIIAATALSFDGKVSVFNELKKQIKAEAEEKKAEGENAAKVLSELDSNGQS